VSYTVEIKSGAEKQMLALPKGILWKVHERIESLAENPRPLNAKKLAMGMGWRIRVGIYRIIYQVDDGKKTVTIVRVKHRKDVYRS
jgi:mRNA interferase RelE/StbE